MTSFSSIVLNVNTVVSISFKTHQILKLTMNEGVSFSLSKLPKSHVATFRLSFRHLCCGLFLDTLDFNHCRLCLKIKWCYVTS